MNGELERAKGLPRLMRRPQPAILDVEKIANGTFSPLRGFMGSTTLSSVIEDLRLDNGLPWTIPVVFHASLEEAEGLNLGDEAAIWNAAEDEIAGTIRVDEIFDVDRENLIEKVFGTKDCEHPGVGQVHTWGERLVAGEITLLRRSKSLIPGGYDLGPREVRAAFAERGWKTVVGFQTRNVGHRAHEHLQKIALEQVDGLLIHPLIGWKKPGDMLPEVVLDGYEILIDRYYPEENVLLAGLTTAMRYAGPREAIFHAIIRKNFGCTHFIIGRDHAGVGGYYEKYAGHELARRLEADLGITIMKLHGPCWCATCEAIVTEHTCPHRDAWRDISGTEVRAMLRRGERPPAFFSRPEIGDFLVERAREGRCFFEG